MEHLLADPYVDIMIFVLLSVVLVTLSIGISTLRSIRSMGYREASRTARRGFLNSLPIIATGVISNSVMLGISYPYVPKSTLPGPLFLLGWGAVNSCLLLCGGMMLLNAIIARKRVRTIVAQEDEEGQ